MKERGYSRRFYTEFYDHTLASARIIVPLVVDLLHPGSVVDVGCGCGPSSWHSSSRESKTSSGWTATGCLGTCSCFPGNASSGPT